MEVVYLDTHVAIWLVGGEVELISPRSLKLIDTADHLRISPIVVLELQYLFELKKIKYTAQEIRAILEQDFHVSLCSFYFQDVIKTAIGFHWTRDPFDRIMTAHAQLAKAVLITKDRVIRQHYRRAIWD